MNFKGLMVLIGLLFSMGAWALPDETEDLMNDAFAEMEEQFTLRFFDAVTGKPIKGAKVKFEGKTGRTDRNGAVKFDFPANLDPSEDQRIAVFKKSDYSSAKVKVDFMAGSLWFNRYSISPKLKSKMLRIVLDWGADPADLDAHLVKSGSYHISYREMRKYEDRAWLDRDDMNGHGPETVTVKKLDRNASYEFFIHDYTNRARQGAKALSESRAHVRVYDESGLVNTFRAPRDSRGNKWTVFKVVNGELIPSNRIE